MKPFILHIDTERKQIIQIASEVSSKSMGEVVRLMITHCGNSEALNKIFPLCSGAVWGDLR